MKVFVTGASGFIGSAVVKELLDHGHEVLGLARSAGSATAIQQAGAKVLEGTLEDIDILKQGATWADGVIHTAFIHDFTQYAKSNEVDKKAILSMGEVLVGKPIVVTAGILFLPMTNGVVTEADAAAAMPRSSEVTALSLVENGVLASVIRLPPSVHDKGDKGFVPFIIQQAKKHGVSAYPGDGTNRWPAVHRLDAAKLFRLALEKGAKGARYNAIGETGIETKEIATVIGSALNMPVQPVSGASAEQHFEWMARFISADNPAIATHTKEQLGWNPTGIGLLEDIRKNYL